MLNIVSLYMSESLDAPFTTNDVRDALFGMGAWKSPGPDGLHARFFQENWGFIGGGCDKGVLRGAQWLEINLAFNCNLYCAHSKDKIPKEGIKFSAY